MARVTTLRSVELPVGSVLGLSKAQASARAHQLEPAKRKGHFVTTARVQFKAGEAFDIEGQPPKDLADALDVEGAAPKAPRTSAATVQTSAPAADATTPGSADAAPAGEPALAADPAPA